MAQGPAVEWRPRHNPWLVTISVLLATFMEVLDTSIANVALPHIGGALGASNDEATWVLTSYLVSNAIVLPLGGWASSVMGRRNFFVFCISGFTAASFLCGIAPVWARSNRRLPRSAGGCTSKHATQPEASRGRRSAIDGRG